MKNWEIAERYLAGTLATIEQPDMPVSVIWCKLPESVNGDELKVFLEKNNNVHVVPGKYFFWSNPENNKGYVRIALARDTINFEESMKALREGLITYAKHFIKK